MRKPGRPIPGSFIREVRLQRRLTQAEVAKKLGLKGGKGTVSDWETGKNRCSGPAAELFLSLFNVKAPLEVLSTSHGACLLKCPECECSFSRTLIWVSAGGVCPFCDERPPGGTQRHPAQHGALLSLRSDPPLI